MHTCTQLCTFSLDNQLYGVDVQSVQEVLRYQQMTEVPLASHSVCGLINLRGQIVTAIDLRKRLGLAPLPEGQLPMNVVIRTDDGAISLLVDQIGDVLDLDQQSFEPPPETLKGTNRALIRGAFKMADRLLLVLDIAHAIHLTTDQSSN